MSLFDEIMEVRDSGLVNMFDANGVQCLANEMGFYDLVLFIEEDKKAYCQFILSGDESLLE